MVFIQQRHLYRLASVQVSVSAAVAATVAAAAAVAAAAEHLLHHHLLPLHRRSQLPELHSIAQLSVVLRQQRQQLDVLHHADRARHWKAPDSDLL